MTGRAGGPRVVVVEATDPWSFQQTHLRWEPQLLAAGYLFASFDGINRFYACAEEPELVAHLAPASVLDNFVSENLNRVEGYVRHLEAELKARSAHVAELETSSAFRRRSSIRGIVVSPSSKRALAGRGLSEGANESSDSPSGELRRPRSGPFERADVHGLTDRADSGRDGDTGGCVHREPVCRPGRVCLRHEGGVTLERVGVGPEDIDVAVSGEVLFDPRFGRRCGPDVALYPCEEVASREVGDHVGVGFEPIIRNAAGDATDEGINTVISRPAHAVRPMLSVCSVTKDAMTMAASRQAAIGHGLSGEKRRRTQSPRITNESISSGTR